MVETLRDADKRPDPDALLALAGGGGRGRLTVFLGAAPGVGKTYAMLARAKRLKADGIDIVVGLVEAHGRAETLALLDGLEVLPRRQIAYQGKTIEEFDLDAALKRRPRIMIVDELAHSNAPESRHPKRYQDVEELLAAGIDVWSAMNVQHLESLSDVVAQITGVQVRERVPDTVVSRADDVLLVDLAPAELLERLKEGKVYLPENAKRAADSFFRLGNLTALREMALRRTAARVDTQVVDYLKQNAITSPWQTAERFLVCIGPDALSEKVVRTAARLASGLNAPWLVASIERPDRPGNAAAASRVEKLFKLAADLGAETRRVAGTDFVEEILTLARREHATQVVIGARSEKSPFGFLRRSLTDALVDRVSGIGIHIVTADEDAPTPKQIAAPARRFDHPLQDIGIAVAAVGLATLVGYSVERFIDLPNVSVLYLLAVLVAAIYGGYLSAVSAALLSAVAYNFFFIPPVSTFTIAEPHEVVGLLTFIAAALLAAGLASRVREQAKAARERAASTQALYEFSRKLSGTAKADDVVWATVSQLQAALKRGIVLLLQQSGDLTLTAAWPPDTDLSVADMTAARWAYEKQEMAGYATGTLPNSAFQFRPLVSPSGVIGVIGVQQAEKPLEGDDLVLLTAILDQTVVAIDRARLSKESLDQAQRLEGERFRSALLSSISHDLKTPLATITGAVTSLRQLGAKMKPASRDDLLLSIEEEGNRLTRFVGNLLDMTKIDAGTVNPKREWVDVADVIRSSLERARIYFPDKLFETSVAHDLPLARGDSVLLGQVLFNLFDNAVKYGGDEPISIYARRDGSDVTISVTDLGKGIAPKDMDRIFEKFFTRSKADGRKPGTGLGLAISRGFVEAMGGTIKAESPAQKRRGTRLTVRLPAGNPIADGEAGA